MLEESGEADSGSAEEQPEEEYPDRGRVEDVPWPEGSVSCGPFFISPRTPSSFLKKPAPPSWRRSSWRRMAAATTRP